jgi:protein required for attachment to host cells
MAPPANVTVGPGRRLRQARIGSISQAIDRSKSHAMDMNRINTGDWVVVCDGRKALICVNAGDEKSLNLRLVEERAADNPPTSAQGTDRPGRVQQSVGARRGAVQQTDWHDRAEQAFLAELAKRLDGAIAARETSALVIAAPARALGMLRPQLAAATRKAVRRELEKDYVKVPLSELEKRLRET